MLDDHSVYPVEQDPPVADWTPIGATLRHDKPVPSGIVPVEQEMLDTHTLVLEGTTTVPFAQLVKQVPWTREYPDGQLGADICFVQANHGGAGAAAHVFACNKHQKVLLKLVTEEYTNCADSPSALIVTDD